MSDTPPESAVSIDLDPGTFARMRAECWYNLPEIANDAAVMGAIWWWVRDGEWSRSPLTLLALAFAVSFSLRLLQLVTYSEGLNRVVLNTFGHNVWLWLIVIAEAVWFIDQYKFFTVALFLMAHHLFLSNVVDVPGRLLVDRRYGGDAPGAFERRIRAQDGLPPPDDA